MVAGIILVIFVVIVAHITIEKFFQMSEVSENESHTQEDTNLAGPGFLLPSIFIIFMNRILLKVKRSQKSRNNNLNLEMFQIMELQSTPALFTRYKKIQFSICYIKRAETNSQGLSVHFL